MGELSTCSPKDELRALVRGRIRAMTQEERQYEAEAACASIAGLSAFRKARLVLAYMPLPLECSPLPLIEEARKLGKRLVFPLCLPEQRLAFYEVDGEEGFARGSFNILEPVPGKCRLVIPGEIEFAVIPGVAFDRQCNRMGRGAGYYDRMLPQLACTKVGLCFETQVLDALPVEKWDVPMDFLAAKNGIIVKNEHSCL